MNAGLPPWWSWIREGHGSRPELLWTSAADALPTHVLTQWESGGCVVADADGGLVKLDRSGAVAQRYRHGTPFSVLAAPHTGGTLFGVDQQQTLIGFGADLRPRWSHDLKTAVLSGATTPFGRLVALGLDSGEVRLFDADGRSVGDFQAPQPLGSLLLMPSRPALVGLSSRGWFGEFDLSGVPDGKWSGGRNPEPEWFVFLSGRVTGAAVTGDGQALLCANPPAGLLLFDDQGRGRGTLRTPGAVRMLAPSERAKYVAFATEDGDVVCADWSGQMKFLAHAPEDVAAIASPPSGRGVVVALESGKIGALGF